MIVDDFHRLDDDVRREVADYLKTLADEESHNSKLIVVGINRAGESLIRFARDLVNRIDIIRFEANPDERVNQLIAQGEEALNISLGIRDAIVKHSNGSFYIAQMLCLVTAVVLPIPDGPSMTTPRPGDRRATRSLSYSIGGTKVYDGIPESLKTSSSNGSDMTTEFRCAVKSQVVGDARAGGAFVPGVDRGLDRERLMLQSFAGPDAG